jgi:uncharacterized protein (DUF2236 family)
MHGKLFASELLSPSSKITGMLWAWISAVEALFRVFLQLFRAASALLPRLFRTPPGSFRARRILSAMLLLAFPRRYI